LQASQAAIASPCGHFPRWSLFRQAADDLGSLEQRDPFLFVELSNGLRQPCPFRFLGALPDGGARSRFG